MSNTLYINVVKVENLGGGGGGGTDYGYTASDSYGSTYNLGWSCLSDFLQDHPSADALKSHVLINEEVFNDFREGESGSVLVYFPETGDDDGASDEHLRALCEQNGIRVVEATEDEVLGMWDWLDDSGNACDMSFDTEREAMLDALEVFEVDIVG
jgi:hypothetical protein